MVGIQSIFNVYCQINVFHFTNTINDFYFLSVLFINYLYQYKLSSGLIKKKKNTNRWNI